MGVAVASKAEVDVVPGAPPAVIGRYTLCYEAAGGGYVRGCSVAVRGATCVVPTSMPMRAEMRVNVSGVDLQATDRAFFTESADCTAHEAAEGVVYNDQAQMAWFTSSAAGMGLEVYGGGAVSDVVGMRVNFTVGGVYTLCYLVAPGSAVYSRACNVTVVGPRWRNTTRAKECAGATPGTTLTIVGVGLDSSVDTVTQCDGSAVPLMYGTTATLTGSGSSVVYTAQFAQGGAVQLCYNVPGAEAPLELELMTVIGPTGVTTSPSPPFAADVATYTFTGVGLSNADMAMVVAGAVDCSGASVSGGAPLSVTAAGNGLSATVQFTLPSPGCTRCATRRTRRVGGTCQWAT
jgi:hypothetical protein